MTHGIVVWLCPSHGSEAFMTRRFGRDFAERLAAVWAASGVLTARRYDALQAHITRLQLGNVEREKPGSYSWPVLRREAERRFAAGEPPADVIADLRANYCDGPAMVPSVRTMRRWFTQARWLTTPTPSRRRRTDRVRPQTPNVSQWEPFINLMVAGVAHRHRPVPGRRRRPG